MATHSYLTDDLDGSQDSVQTVTLRLDDDAVEIDLSDANYAKLQKAVGKYFDKGREVYVRRSSTNFDHDPMLVRRWAKKQGIEVADRGRIAADVLEAYNKAKDDAANGVETLTLVPDIDATPADEGADAADQPSSENQTAAAAT